RREAALARRLGPAVPAVVARQALAPGDRVTAERLGVRRVPARYAPLGALGAPGEAVGMRVSAAIPAGAYVTAGALGGGPGETARDRAPGGVPRRRPGVLPRGPAAPARARRRPPRRGRARRGGGSRPVGGLRACVEARHARSSISPRDPMTTIEARPHAYLP